MTQMKKLRYCRKSWLGKMCEVLLTYIFEYIFNTVSWMLLFPQGMAPEKEASNRWWMYDTHDVCLEPQFFGLCRLLIYSVHPAAMRLIHSPMASPGTRQFSAEQVSRTARNRPYGDLRQVDRFPFGPWLRTAQTLGSGRCPLFRILPKPDESAAFIVDAF